MKRPPRADVYCNLSRSSPDRGAQSDFPDRSKNHFSAIRERDRAERESGRESYTCCFLGGGGKGYIWERGFGFSKVRYLARGARFLFRF